MRLAETLKRARDGAGLSLRDVAKQACLSAMYISELERGIKVPISGTALNQLAAFYGLEPNRLLEMAFDDRKEKALRP